MNDTFINMTDLLCDGPHVVGACVAIFLECARVVLDAYVLFDLTFLQI
jgi:hypothetical protein